MASIELWVSLANQMASRQEAIQQGLKGWKSGVDCWLEELSWIASSHLDPREKAKRNH